jgi:hypothetical protein
MSSWAVVKEFKEAGFSTRVAHGLAYGAAIGSLVELRNELWEDTGDAERPGLLLRISRVPGCGRKALAEARAFREGLNPSDRRPPGRVNVSVPLPPDMLAKLDAFIAAQPKRCSRPEAIRAFVAAGLHLMGES